MDDATLAGGSMAKAHVGETASADTRARMSASHTGLRHSAETRAKIRAANYRRWHTQPATPAPDFDGAVEFLDENMTRRDLVYVLEHLRFPGREALGTLRLDRQVRDFLVRSVCPRPAVGAWPSQGKREAADH